MKFNYFIPVLFASVAYTTTFAQTPPPPKQWDKRFGGTTDDGITCIRQTSDGGYILGGTSVSGIGGDKTQANWDTSGLTSDYWLVKTNAKGIKQWDARFGGTSLDYLKVVEPTTDGGYILGGWSASDSSGDKTQNGWGSFDFWIVKINGDGVKQWDKRFGGDRDDVLTCLQQTKDGGYILGGKSKSRINGDKTEDSRGSTDFWAVKINANGVKQWDKCYGGREEDEMYALKQTADGGYIFAGTSESGIGGDKTQASKGEDDYWVIKTDANGIKQWDKDFGGDEDDYLYSLDQTKDGGYILGGKSNSGISGDKTEANWDPTNETSDYWVVKITATGIKQWDKRFGGANVDVLYTLQQTNNLGYILGGFSSSGLSGDKSQAGQGTSDFWIVKINDRGKKQWDKRFGGTNREGLFSLRQTSDSGYILGGKSFSNISGDKTQQNRDITEATPDFWMVKLGCPPNAEITAKGNLDICTTHSVLLQADSSEGCKYQWIKDDRIIAGAVQKNYTATEPGAYTVVVYINSKCSDKSKPVTVINSCKETVPQISLYPNPSGGNVTIAYRSDISGNVQLRVYEKTGKTMFAKTEKAIKGNNTFHLNLTNVTPGIYTLQINDSRKQDEIKFVIEK